MCGQYIYSPYTSVYVYSKDELGSQNLLPPPPQHRPAPPYMVLGIKSMAFCTLGKRCTSELHPQPFCSWHVWCVCSCVCGYTCCVPVHIHVEARGRCQISFLSLFLIFVQIHLFLFYMYVSWYICLCIICMPSIWRSQKKMLDPLELELQWL